MIDFELLDKKRIYLGLQYGTGVIAKKIVKYSKCYAPNSKEIPTHVLALVYRKELGDWWIYESHLDGHAKLGIPSGSRRFSRVKWLDVEGKKLNEFVAIPMDIDFKQLEYWVGYKYGKGDIAELMRVGLIGKNGNQKDRSGLICSEFIALAYPCIGKYFNLPHWCITPAHFQRYIEDKGFCHV